MRQTLIHVGPAMLSTSAILVIGFGVLTLSSFQMTSHLGWLCLLIVGIAPVADLLIAPALVLLLVRAPGQRQGWFDRLTTSSARTFFARFHQEK